MSAMVSSGGGRCAGTVLHSSVTEATPVRAVSGCRFIYFRFAAVICRVRGGIAANWPVWRHRDVTIRYEMLFLTCAQKLTRISDRTEPTTKKCKKTRQMASYFCRNSADFSHPHLYSAPPTGATPFEVPHDLWHQKTPVLVLLCRLICMILCLAISSTTLFCDDDRMHRTSIAPSG